jgi:hypothetical protein
MKLPNMAKKEGESTMTDILEQRAKDLKAKKDAGTISPEEEAVRVSLLDVDEADEDLTAAKGANPVPDPVAVAQTAFDTAMKSYNDSEIALAAAVGAVPGAPVPAGQAPAPSAPASPAAAPKA